MFSHLTLGTHDLARAKTFYDAVLATIGVEPRFHEPEQGWLGYQTPGSGRPLLVLMTPFDGTPATVGNGTMTAFLASTRAQVDAFHAAALSEGGRDEGRPGLRPRYHPYYYGAYVRDPDGHKLACACHSPS